MKTELFRLIVQENPSEDNRIFRIHFRFQVTQEMFSQAKKIEPFESFTLKAWTEDGQTMFSQRADSWIYEVISTQDNASAIERAPDISNLFPRVFNVDRDLYLSKEKGHDYLSGSIRLGRGSGNFDFIAKEILTNGCLHHVVYLMAGCGGAGMDIPATLNVEVRALPHSEPSYRMCAGYLRDDL